MRSESPELPISPVQMAAKQNHLNCDLNDIEVVNHDNFGDGAQNGGESEYPRRKANGTECQPFDPNETQILDEIQNILSGSAKIIEFSSDNQSS